MSLQFVLTDAKNIRVWSAALSSLARVGKSVTVEWRSDEIVLRALTDTQNAFAAFHFSLSFFESMTDPTTLPADVTCEVVKTKFASRVLAAASKYSRGVTKVHAYFARSDAEHLFVMRAELKNGLVRTHTLTFEDTAILEPLFDRHKAPFQLAARPSMLHAVLKKIHGTEEMSVLATTGVVQFQSYHELSGGDAPGAARGALHTALAYAVLEFNGVQLDHKAAGDATTIIGGEPLISVTFNIKELKVRMNKEHTMPLKGCELLAYTPLLFPSQLNSSYST